MHAILVRAVIVVAPWFLPLTVTGARQVATTSNTSGAQACCFQNGTCLLLLENVCIGSGGIPFEGDCEPNPCPQPITGACCEESTVCTIRTRLECENVGGAYIGDDVPCDPNPCPAACCLPEHSCILLSDTACTLAGGTFHGSLDCDPDPCEETGACCYFLECVQIPSAECIQNGGIFLGAELPCEEETCLATSCSGERVSLAEIGLEGDLTDRGATAPASLRGNGLLGQQPRQHEFRLNGSRCGEFLFNSDSTYEGAITWRYGGVVPPCFGAFADKYVDEEGFVCAVVLDLTTTEPQSGQVLDAYIWEDQGGMPGAVLAIAVGRDPGPIADWPSISRHSIPISPVAVQGSWWSGYWGDWPGEMQGWFVAIDLDGPGGGRPVSRIAPGIGYPTGWQDVSVVWGPTQALGIGVEILAEDRGACCIEGTCLLLLRTECEERNGEYRGAGSECEPGLCNPVPVVRGSWGEIKTMFR